VQHLVNFGSDFDIIQTKLLCRKLIESAVLLNIAIFHLSENNMKLCQRRPTYLFIKVLIAGVISLATTVTKAQYFDSFSVEVGEGVQSTIYKLGAQKTFSELPLLAQYHLYPYWEITLARINERMYRNTPGRKKGIYVVGLTPVMRWQQDVKQGVFAEIGIGLNYFSERYQDSDMSASTRFEFGDHIGIGYKFSNSAEITFKVLHYSNAGIDHPNPGINFRLLKFAYSF